MVRYKTEEDTSRNIFRAFKSKNMRWSGHIARTVEINTQNVLVAK
jgi:hypothetical protein